MLLPPGTTYGDIGMSKFFKYFILFFYFCKVKQKYFWMMFKYQLNMYVMQTYVHDDWMEFHNIVGGTGEMR
jgi:hypothetical protein